jgi:hypothetical protein
MGSWHCSRSCLKLLKGATVEAELSCVLICERAKDGLGGEAPKPNVLGHAVQGAKTFVDKFLLLEEVVEHFGAAGIVRGLAGQEFD